MRYPKVSILVAARNEEENILNLLESLEKLQYPKSALQILIGNDASTDQTAQIISDFIKEKSHFELINIDSQIGHLKGKANVLAHLAHFTDGEYFFFTDADITVPESWISNMLQLFDEKPNTGIVVGITLVNARNWFEGCQALEWLFALKMMNSLSKMNIRTTGMGNNMAVSAKAYKEIGGYEKIGFSIVEDYALYKEIVEKGYEFVHGFSEGIMTITKPPQNYFEQRKRWVTGGMQSASNLIIPALIQGIALPILLIISIFSWRFSLGVFVLNFIINHIIGFSILKDLKRFNLFKYLPAYTIYMYIFWFLQFVNYFLPTKLVWKGREY